MMLHTQYQSSRPCGFRFMFLPYMSLCKTCDPGEGPFLPQGHNLKKKLGRGSFGDAKYQISML